MNENPESQNNNVDDNNEEQKKYNHEHDYTFISSYNGDYKVCRGCGDVILVFSRGY